MFLFIINIIIFLQKKEMFIKYNLDNICNVLKEYRWIVNNKKNNIFYKRKNILNQLPNFFIILEKLIQNKNTISYYNLIEEDIELSKENKKEQILKFIYKKYNKDKKEKEYIFKAIERNQKNKILYYFINNKIFQFNKLWNLKNIIHKILDKTIKERKQIQKNILNKLEENWDITLAQKRKLRNEIPFTEFINNLNKDKDVSSKLYEIYILYKFFPFIQKNNIFNIQKASSYISYIIELNDLWKNIFKNITNENEIILLKQKYILEHNINFFHYIIISYILYYKNIDKQNIQKKYIIKKAITEVKNILNKMEENHNIHLVDFFTNNNRFLINKMNDRKNWKIYFNKIIQNIIKTESKNIYVYFNKEIYKFTFKNSKTDNKFNVNYIIL